MAAAAIPMVVSALSPLIPSIITAVEGWFGGKSGPQKLAAASNIATAAAQGAVSSGTLAAMPDPSTIAALVESAVQTMIKAGQLPSTAAGSKGTTVTPASVPAPVAATIPTMQQGKAVTIVGVIYQ